MLRSVQLHHPSPPLPVPLRPRTVPSKSQSQTPLRALHFSQNPYVFAPRIAPCGRIFAGPDSLPADEFEVELGRLLALLPEEMRRRVSEHPELHQLIEVVMDLGRKPLARFPTGDFVLSDCPISVQDIEHATSQVGDFAVDNRAGISRTLHRISGIRNRKGTIIGLTCRVGRAISGSANLLRDLVQDGSSLLLIGPPGVGKTTIIREIARMLANDCQKRVMIVDTSNEIGGDGDIPHGGIGNARRMQVPNNDMQHKVLIEAVENHMPQVIVIDEIGTKLEAMAASTIAQRGIQLVATAHGITIENLTMNPSLEMLVGGIQSVTLGDEEASRRGVQKTVLERKGPSTFSCGVEIISKTELRVHRSLEATVDAILSGRLPKVEVRKMNSHETQEAMLMEALLHTSSDTKNRTIIDNAFEMDDERVDDYEFAAELSHMGDNSSEARGPLCLFLYGILEASVVEGMRQLKMDDDSIQFTEIISEANVILALQSKLKKNARFHSLAKSHGNPIYVTKTNSLVQITKALRALVRDYEDGSMNFGSDDTKSSEEVDALEEARIAIEQVVIPKGEPVELLPRQSGIMSLQMELIQEYQLKSEKVGSEPDVRLRILPLQSGIKGNKRTGEAIHAGNDSDDFFNENDDFFNENGNANGSPSAVNKLPFLSD